MTDAMLTTVDNPYNPFTDWDEWYAFDTREGYNSLSLLARVCIASDELSDDDVDEAVDDAVDEIVNENVSGMHRKIYEDQKIIQNDDGSLTITNSKDQLNSSDDSTSTSE